MAKVCKKAVVTGLVQGVFFRVSTQQQANFLGVSGYVKNTINGSVEVLACGELDAVNKLLAWLHIGSQQCRVDDVKKESVPYLEFPDFEVRR